MTDREMLFMAYGAMKAVTGKESSYSNVLENVVMLIEEHFYPPVEIVSSTTAVSDPNNMVY